MANPKVDTILENLQKHSSKIYEAVTTQLAELLQVRHELLGLSEAEWIGRQAISEYMKNYKIVSGYRKDIAAGKYQIDGEGDQATKNKAAFEGRVAALEKCVEKLESAIERLTDLKSTQAGSLQHASMVKILEVLREMDRSENPMEIAENWALDQKNPFTLAVDLGGAYGPAFGNIPHTKEPDVRQINIAHLNLAAKDPRNQEQFLRLDSLVNELARELDRVREMFAPYYRGDKSGAVTPTIQEEARQLQEKVEDIQGRLEEIMFIFTKTDSYRSVEDIPAHELDLSRVEYALSGNVSKSSLNQNLNKILRLLDELLPEG